MRLDDFELDLSNSLLINSQTQQQYHLTRTELQVLEQLALHANQVMTKGQLACAGSGEPVMSESAVAKAVFTLRKHLGEHYENIIETVPKQGYRLNLREQSPEWLQKRKKHLLVLGVGLLVSLIVLMMSIAGMHKYIWFEQAKSPVKQSRNVTLESQEQLHLVWLTSPKASSDQIDHMERSILSALNKCAEVQWRYVYLAISNDMQVLNISMEGVDDDGHSHVRNIKTSDFSLAPTYISSLWLEEVSLCG
ncbi:winged helix-turn-helix transcriptional regulator [Shewanella sp. WXL01]|uniref:winged helix-turn-helix domain-containing protein n=1 Tax=Shewanella sp. WXL01 TaxID=2709721 RepID=UPI0014384408|nr:winged helix-turn-helix domain-containing protein [Shewanella sp. WXL01]NKF51011.1 winged helix-turn-helix transcriptional regulator [Shewanella sp. WXL01]